jgi:uncharacterized protein (TIGR02421 family)
VVKNGSKGVDPRLLNLAQKILEPAEHGPELADDAGLDEVLPAVHTEIAWYREQVDNFVVRVEVDNDLSSTMMVSHGVFYIDGRLRIPSARVQPLIQHEVGTHILTRHNGRRQSLRQFEVGLAHYDPLQEGLGVLAEYLSGFLPGERLRTLAARVVAVDMAIDGVDVPAIFDLLHNTHGFDQDEAFDIAVRALRGGGLTKDAVYLSGLRDLIEYLHDGGEFAELFVGKFALSHRRVLDQLIEEGWVTAPELMPRYLTDAAGEQRLERCRHLEVDQLFHKEPC